MDEPVLLVLPDPPRYRFDRSYPPLVTIAPGDLFQVVTSDAGYRAAVEGGFRAEDTTLFTLNALTGPIAIHGAEPGDALVVTIDAIDLSDMAYVVYVDRWGRATFGMDGAWIEPYRVSEGKVLLPGGSIALRPMVGCIGVAPARDSLSSLSPGARTGGNLDLRELEPGVSIWLPVDVEGGLLSLGDLHAAMGTGEPAGAGLECAGTVTLRVDVVADRRLATPRIETATEVLFLGTVPGDLYAAKQQAVRAAWEFLAVEGDVPARRAFAICSGLLAVRFGGPAGGNVLAGFEKAALREAGIHWETRLRRTAAIGGA